MGSQSPPFILLIKKKMWMGKKKIAFGRVPPGGFRKEDFRKKVFPQGYLGAGTPLSRAFHQALIGCFAIFQLRISTIQDELLSDVDERDLGMAA